MPPSDPLQALAVVIVTNTNPQRHVNLSVSPFGAVSLHIVNLGKSEAQPIVARILAALPEAPAGEPAQVPEARVLGEDYLPGPFRPVPIPKVSDRTVFVIMSFDRDYRDAYNLAIEPTLRGLGFNPIRIDQVQHNSTVTAEILRYIERSIFVVADLTGERPNVYYEVGYAHRADKEVILLARKSSAVHFDVAAINRIEYEDYTELVDALRKRVVAIAERLEIALQTVDA